MALTTKGHNEEELVKKYYRIITKKCRECSPKIEDAFDLRKSVINRLYEIIVENKEA